MITATWNGTIVAESDHTKVVEGNHYFPLEDLRPEYFKASATTTRCPWKDKASYYDIVVDGLVNHDAAWTYPKPTLLARKITGYVAFWHGVEVAAHRSTV